VVATLGVGHVHSQTFTNADFEAGNVGFAPGFVLQRTASVAKPQSSTVANSDGVTSIWLPKTSSNEFFRLARP